VILALLYIITFYIVTLQGIRLYSASRPLENNEAKTSCFFKSSMEKNRYINFFGAGQWLVIFFNTYFFFFFFGRTWGVARAILGPPIDLSLGVSMVQ
jgi:hypothetical protein